MELLDRDFDDRLKKRIGNQFCQAPEHYSSQEGKAAKARNTVATAFALMAAATTNR
jgi:hypothetical protein